MPQEKTTFSLIERLPKYTGSTSTAVRITAVASLKLKTCVAEDRSLVFAIASICSGVASRIGSMVSP